MFVSPDLRIASMPVRTTAGIKIFLLVMLLSVSPIKSYLDRNLIMLVNLNYLSQYEI